MLPRQRAGIVRIRIIAMAVIVFLMVWLPCLFGLTNARAVPNIECRKQNAECRIKTDTWSIITGCKEDHGYYNGRSDFEQVYGNRRGKISAECVVRRA